MTPPKLTRNAPIFNIFHPLSENIFKSFWNKVHFIFRYKSPKTGLWEEKQMTDAPSPKSDKVHSAVFPFELCKRVIEYYSFWGDLVFDPFGGSGTLGRTAKSLGRRFFLTELDSNYFEYMKSFRKEDLFNEQPTKFLTFEQFKRLAK